MQWLGASMVLWGLSAPFRDIFASMGVSLPGITRLVLALSERLLHDWIWFVPLCLALPPPLLFLPRRPARFAAWGVRIAGALLWAGSAWGLVIPIVEMQKALAQ